MDIFNQQNRMAKEQSWCLGEVILYGSTVLKSEESAYALSSW